MPWGAKGCQGCQGVPWGARGCHGVPLGGRGGHGVLGVGALSRQLAGGSPAAHMARAPLHPGFYGRDDALIKAAHLAGWAWMGLDGTNNMGSDGSDKRWPSGEGSTGLDGTNNSGAGGSGERREAHLSLRTGWH